MPAASPGRSKARARVKSAGFYFPGEKIDLKSLPLSDGEIRRLHRLGQEFTYISAEDSTALMIRAARDALQAGGSRAADIRLVISAPSLLTSYGLEIPAIAVRAALELRNAHCLNIAQGCAGVLKAIDLAAQLLSARPGGGDILVVTSCRASAHTRNMNHGAFFWGDAAAAVVLTAEAGPGVEIVDYAEASADEDWGAMRIDFGDAAAPPVQQDGVIRVAFDGPEAQMNYIRGEQKRFGSVIGSLLAAHELPPSRLEALFLPSTGRNRLPVLFTEHEGLSSRVATDFRCAHLGGVDPLLTLHQYCQGKTLADGAWLAALAPAFAAQWSGLLLRHRV